MITKTIEGVEYSAFVVRFCLADGRVRRWVRWSPTVGAWVRDEVGRELLERFGERGVKERSCTITRRAS